MFFHSRILRRTTHDIKSFDEVRLKHRNAELYQQFIENFILINRFTDRLSRYLKTNERASIFSDRKEPVKSMRKLYQYLNCLIEDIHFEDYEHFLHVLIYLNGKLGLLHNVDDTLSLQSLDNELLELESRRPTINRSTLIKDGIGVILILSTFYLLGAVLLNPMAIIASVLAGFYILGVVVKQVEDMHHVETIDNYRLFSQNLTEIDRIIDTTDKTTLASIVALAHEDHSQITTTFFYMAIRSIRDSVENGLKSFFGETFHLSPITSPIEGTNAVAQQVLSL